MVLSDLFIYRLYLKYLFYCQKLPISYSDNILFQRMQRNRVVINYLTVDEARKVNNQQLPSYNDGGYGGYGRNRQYGGQFGYREYGGYEGYRGYSRMEDAYQRNSQPGYGRVENAYRSSSQPERSNEAIRNERFDNYNKETTQRQWPICLDCCNCTCDCKDCQKCCKGVDLCSCLCCCLQIICMGLLH